MDCFPNVLDLTDPSEKKLPANFLFLFKSFDVRKNLVIETSLFAVKNFS